MSLDPPPVWDKKQSVDVDDFRFNFKDWLGFGETIVSASAVVTPPNQLQVQQVTIDGPRVVVWLINGNAGASYELDVTFNTSAGRILLQPSTVVINT